MAMAKDNYEKELARVAAKVKEVKMECNRVGKSQAIAILALAVIMVVGLFCNFANEAIVNFVGFVLALLSGLVIIVLYAVLRIKGVINYTVYNTVNADGKSFTVTVEGKKKITVLQGDVALHFERGSVFAGEKPSGGVPWDWFTAAEISACDTPTSSVKRYRGSYSGKRTLLHIRDGKPDYGEAGGVRIHYLEVNCLTSKLMLPRELYDAAKAAFGELPGFILCAEK